MRSIHVFVISWAGQHENALSIVNALKRVANQISLVYSDPNPAMTLVAGCDVVRRPNDLFWGDKFKACLDLCDSERMLIIHADCACSDWGWLLQKCRSTMERNPMIGVWAPLIDWTALNVGRTRIAAVQPGDLTVVAQTDAIVFCLSAPVIRRMRLAHYDKNIYGWGIDAMAVAYCFSNNLLAVVDESIRVAHPRGRGYEGSVALAQCLEFLKQLSTCETVQYGLLWSHIKYKDARSLAAARVK